MSTADQKKSSRHSTGSTNSGQFFTPLKKRLLLLNSPDTMDKNVSNDHLNIGEPQPTVITTCETDSKTDTTVNADQLTDRQLLEDIWRDLKGVKNSQAYNDREIVDLKEKVHSLEVQKTEQDKRITALETELASIKRGQLDEKSYSMRQNLLFDNIDYTPNENLVNKLRVFCKNDLKIEHTDSIKFERVHRLRKQRGTSSPATVVARFHAYADRVTVWSARFNRHCSSRTD